jgi:hypothetical protein
VADVCGGLALALVTASPPVRVRVMAALALAEVGLARQAGAEGLMVVPPDLLAVFLLASIRHLVVKNPGVNSSVRP